MVAAIDRYEIMKEHMPIGHWVKWETLNSKGMALSVLRRHLYWLVDHGWVEYQSPHKTMCVNGAKFKLRNERLIVPMERSRRPNKTQKSGNGVSGVFSKEAERLWLKISAQSAKVNALNEKARAEEAILGQLRKQLKDML